MNRKKIIFFLKRLEEVHLSHIEACQKLKKTREHFLLLLEWAVEKEQQSFTTPFTKLAYLAQRHQFDAKLNYLANHFRVHSRQPGTKPATCARLARLGVAVCLHIIERVSHQPIHEEFNNLPYKLPAYRPGGADIVAYRDYIRAAITTNDRQAHILTGILDDDKAPPVRIRYAVPDKNDSFTESCELLGTLFELPTTVALIGTEIDKDGLLTPRAIVIEPDYLIDISTIASIAGQQAGKLLYLINKYLPYSFTPPIMLGQIANFFLDKLVTSPQSSFDELFPQVFKLYPLELATWTNDMVKNIHLSAKRHFENIRHVLDRVFPLQNISLQKSMLEPSFYANRYGIQGRLDLFHEGDNEQRDIIELKSGKPFKANKYGLNKSHYIQTLLYDLLIRAVNPHAKIKPTTYILYSGQSESPLRFAPRATPVQEDSLRTRNEILAIEKALVRAGQSENPEVLFFKTKQTGLHELKGFVRNNFAQFREMLDELDPVEMAYFSSFTSFVAREHWLAKVGEPYSAGRSGQAGLWLRSPDEKDQDFDILRGLQVRDIDTEADLPILHFNKTAATNPLANFRVGDVVILYPEVSGTTVLNHQVLKASILELSDRNVAIQLRSPQVRTDYFHTNNTWIIEPDLYENNFRSLHRALFQWAKADKARRDLLLTRRAPVPGTPRIYVQETVGLTDEQHQLLNELLSSRDYYLLWGPPGTGKTSVIIRRAVQHLYRHTDQKILLLAYTNRAVDEICAAIEHDLPEIRHSYFRLGNLHSTAPEYRAQLLSEKIKGYGKRAEVKQCIERHRIVVSTISSLLARPTIFEFFDFDTTIVDEASQILEPQIVGILSRVKRFILVGDHHQLPAVVRQKPEYSRVRHRNLQALGLEDLRTSLFERLYQRAKTNNWRHALGMLSRQGRMHSEVMAFPNEHFYGGKLRTLPPALNPAQHEEKYLFTQASGLRAVLASQRVIFIDTPADAAAIRGKRNLYEAERIVVLLHHLRDLWKENDLVPNERSIGIITPFRAQIAQIRDLVATRAPDWLPLLTIDTVERYQGGARDIIILSVCANDLIQLETLINLSSEGIDRKLNVALTRARHQIIMLGNKQVLSQDRHYGAWIQAAYHLEWEKLMSQEATQTRL